METNDFVVKSLSHCFLCLNKISLVNERSPFVNSEDGSGLQSLSIYSLQNLSCYLKMDLGKVFNENELIPQHLLEKVRNSKLKGELCEQCAMLNDKFSEQYMKLGKIKMEMLSSLRLIRDKILTAMETDKNRKLRKLAKSMTDPDDGWMGKLDILDVLRTEAIQKCTGKISADKPRLKVQNFTFQQIKNCKEKFKSQSIMETAGQNSRSEAISQLQFDLDVRDVKTEFHGPMEFGNEDSYHSDNSEMPDNDNNDTVAKKDKLDTSKPEEDSTNGTAHLVAGHSKSGEDNEMTKRKNYSTLKSSSVLAIPSKSDDVKKPEPYLNPETGKYRCGLCRREFKHETSVRAHHKSVHLGIKYKCSICGKEFSQSSAFNLHHRTIHMGVRVKCSGCNKTFTQKHLLITHQRKHGCKPPVTKTEMT